MSLKALDLRGLGKMTRVGGYFCSGCKSLSEVGLTGCNKLKVIGNYFLHGCRNLEAFDFTTLPKLGRVGGGFMLDCTRLRSVNACKAAVTGIGPDFMVGCHRLAEVACGGAAKGLVERLDGAVARAKAFRQMKGEEEDDPSAKQGVHVDPTPPGV